MLIDRMKVIHDIVPKKYKCRINECIRSFSFKAPEQIRLMGEIATECCYNILNDEKEKCQQWIINMFYILSDSKEDKIKKDILEWLKTLEM